MFTLRSLPLFLKSSSHAAITTLKLVVITIQSFVFNIFLFSCHDSVRLKYMTLLACASVTTKQSVNRSESSVIRRGRRLIFPVIVMTLLIVNFDFVTLLYSRNNVCKQHSGVYRLCERHMAFFRLAILPL